MQQVFIQNAAMLQGRVPATIGRQCYIYVAEMANARLCGGDMKMERKDRMDAARMASPMPMPPAPRLAKVATGPVAAPLSPATAAASRATARHRGAIRTGVIYNPLSHRNQGRDPAFACPPDSVMVQPSDRADLPGLLRDFADRGVTTLVINGGDGTVRDVLTAGYPIFGRDWPTICVLPKGKTNALNLDLGGRPKASLSQTLERLDTLPTRTRQPIVLTPLSPSGERQPPVLGFIMGAGNFTKGTRAAQDAHRAGAFNGLAVGLTIARVIAETLFGRAGNIWREGVAMDIQADANDRGTPHHGVGDEANRALLLASTLQRFPVGVQPFGAGQSGLKLALIDSPRRRIMAMLPAILAGYRPRWLFGIGLHQVESRGFELTIGDDIILDGEAFAAGRYRVEPGPELEFAVP